MANINLEVSAGQSKTITFQSAGKFTTEDVVFNVTGAAGSTTIATSSGTNQITLAHGTKYAITAAGSSYVFTMPSLPSASSSTAGITKVGASGGAAAYGHTHATSIATSTGTNQITLAFGTKYAITAGGTSYVFTMPSNPNTNTTYTIATGDSNGQIKVTPSSGSAYNVSVKGLGSAAYTESTAYAAASHTHSGYLTSSSSLNAANLTGTIPSGCYTNTNNFGTVIVDTPGNFAAKVGIVNFPYVLNAGNCFILNLINSNTVANATLNIRDTGAKDVYLDGAKVSASNWKAGTYLFYFDGERYNTSLKSNPFSDTNTTYTIETGDSNGQIKVTPSSGNAYNINVKGLGSAAYTASTAYAAASHTHSYLPLGGGEMTGKITRRYTSASNDPAIQVLSKNLDTYIWKVDDNDTKGYGFGLKYIGTGTGNNNDLVLFADNQAKTQKEAFRVHQDSTVIFGTTPRVGDVAVSLSNHTHSGYAASSHSHGSITSGGAISSGTALANGDAIVFSDSSDGNKLKKSTITFDGSTTTKFLSQKGTWETPSGGGSTVTGKTVELSTSNQALITVNGSDSGNVKLPDTCPWIADPANNNDIIGGVTPIFRADAPRVVINGSDGDFSNIQDVNSVDTLFLFPDVGKSRKLFALPVVMDRHGHLFVLISEALALDVFLNNGMSTDAGALSGK